LGQFDLMGFRRATGAPEVEVTFLISDGERYRARQRQRSGTNKNSRSRITDQSGLSKLKLSK